MQNPMKNKPVRKMVKVRINVGGRIVKHVFIGALFGILNEGSYRIFSKKKPIEENEKEMTMITPKQEELDVAATLYRKEDIFRKIDGKLHLGYKHNERKSEFIKHFIYGSMIVFLGMEVTKWMRGLSFMKGRSNAIQILVGIPIAIIPYYIFCSLYDRKSQAEFWEKLKEDFMPLGASKFIFDLSQINYTEKIKNSPFQNSKKVNLKLKRATVMLIMLNTFWIFMMTSFYHGRISLNQQPQTK